MGDIVAAEPVVDLVRDREPGARICWVTREPFAALPLAFEGVDEVLTVGCMTEWLLLWQRSLFDAVYDLHHDGRLCEICRISLDKPGVLQNIGTYFDHGNLLDMACDSAGLPRVLRSPRLKPAPSVVASVNRFGLPPAFVVIHCQSSDPKKDWPTARWQQITQWLCDHTALGVVEVGLAPVAISESNDRLLSLCGQLSILETAEVIRRATLFIGIDSGPSHLANAVGTPGVVLIGRLKRFNDHMPYSGSYMDGSNASIVRSHDEMATIPVAAVLSAIAARLGVSQDDRMGPRRPEWR